VSKVEPGEGRRLAVTCSPKSAQKHI
jgi:hypothetical protein